MFEELRADTNSKSFKITPATSPEPPTLSRADHSSVDRSSTRSCFSGAFSSNVSLHSHISSTTENFLDRTITDSLEWDALGTELSSSYHPIKTRSLPNISDQTSQSNMFTPSPKLQYRNPNFSSRAVQNFSNILPISSTPNPPRRHLSRLRQQLPLEQGPQQRNLIPSFVRRFLPLFKRPKSPSQ